MNNLFLLRTLLVMMFCLVATIVIETVAGLILGVSEKEDIIIIMLVNLLTNPVVSIAPTALSANFGWGLYLPLLVLFECIAVVSEAIVYSKCLKYRKLHPILLSFILNAASYLLGLLLNANL